jgi:hypothetical protein
LTLLCRETYTYRAFRPGPRPQIHLQVGDRMTMPAGDGSQADSLPRHEVDLQAELEALRDYVASGMRPMNHRLWLDVGEFEIRIDQIIALLPKEIRRARRILKEEQRIIEDAREEARRTLDEARAEAAQIDADARTRAEQALAAAREEAARLVESSAIRQRAVEQAEATLTRAEETATAVRAQSYEYAEQVMDNVIASLHRLLDSVRKDREQLGELRPDRS